MSGKKFSIKKSYLADALDIIMFLPAFHTAYTYFEIYIYNINIMKKMRFEVLRLQWYWNLKESNLEMSKNIFISHFMEVQEIST